MACSSLASMARDAQERVKVFLRTPEILMLLLAAPALLSLGTRLSGRTRFRLQVCLAVTVLHLLLARLGGFYRYEAYLVAMFLVSAGAALLDLRGAGPWAFDLRADARARWGALTAVVAVLPFLLRAVPSLAVTPQATHEIFLQQHQMARFVRRFYAGAAIAANDIGLVSYQSDPRLFDMAGLASIEVARARVRGAYTTAAIDALTRREGVEIALVYDSWFEGTGLPPSWQKVEQWRVPTRLVLGGDSVSIYAVDPAEAANLAEHLREFSAQLPPEVAVSRVPVR
jgi:hypothetical protein